ncbi:low affinity sulfate transporter 3-like isoform X2 [Macadamia integrifolia]|uniref:low affinity sulfate transporter 3-like isoform X2 n=1 Tax=Macadamia integrifolia TaxID=60698 RepID=UPI001C4EA50E|nr:low affinity sulfate transporter 3-like isoform X2 [Macadamia integrifolia]
MDSLANVSREVDQPQDIEHGSDHVDRTRWVLDTPEPPSLWRELMDKSSSSFKARLQLRSVVLFLEGLFPVLSWGRHYKFWKFKNDLMAGLTLASLSIPQSIGYAGLAKLDPQYGLYTSVVPPLIYGLMGNSSELAIGPVAVVSLLLSSMIQKVVDPGADPITYRRIIFTTTFFAGTFQAVFGLFRLGFLVDFLSHAAIVGFTGGAAILICMQQLKGLLGITHFTNKTDVISVLEAVWRSIHHAWTPLSFLLGCSFLIFILITRFLGRRNRKLFWLSTIAPLISVILSTLIVFLTRADKNGVQIVKHIKGGLNPNSARELMFSGPHVGEAAKFGFISAIIALMEATAIGRSFATTRGYHLDGNKEMLALGVMNIVGSLSSCYVATGSFSRTAVNFISGCQTVVSNLIMAGMVLISLELFTGLLYFTPISILASVILSALPGLIDINGAYHIWKVDKLDFLACIGAFIGVLFASVEIGLLAAVTISFGRILLYTIRPRTEVLGRLPSTDIFCSISQYPSAVKNPGILIIRIQSSLLCFANANYVRERIMKRSMEEEGKGKETKTNEKGRIQVLILDLSNLMNIDTSGIHALEELHKKLASHGIELALANPWSQVIHKLKLAQFVDKIGERIFLTVGEAVQACLPNIKDQEMASL